jgi:hypothetical protein
MRLFRGDHDQSNRVPSRSAKLHVTGGKPSRVAKRAVSFACPIMRMNALYWLDNDEDVPDSEHEVVRCRACGGLHLINRKTGRMWC